MGPTIKTSIAAGLLLSGAAALAQGTFSLQPPVVGSANTADADPPVIRPSTTPCKVQLFSNFQFKGFATQQFSYAPPSACPGPWSKVVFDGDFGVSGTNQYDRTAQIQLGDTMIYLGTTAEPSPTEQPSWHVESDLTDYTALFESAQTGTVELGNVVNKTDNGVQTGSAYLEFYPADLRNPASRTADEVLPLPDLQQSPGVQPLNTTTHTLSQVFTLPANVEAAYLDVFTQGQGSDEIWWIGSPPFREAEVTVDGMPAGLAPILPYFYTGTEGSQLWWPIPGIQTLDLKPYRVDLTPFAGILDNGQPHTIAVSVYDAHDYFNADATLLVFQDHGAQSTSGALTNNTLGGITAPTISRGASSTTTTYAQTYEVSGYVNTSHGRVETAVQSSLSFTNTFDSDPGQVNQMTTATRKSTTRTGLLETAEEDTLTFPLTFVGSATTLSVDQKLTEDKRSTLFGLPLFESHLFDHVMPILTLDPAAIGQVTSATSKETYRYTDTAGHCWSRVVSATNAEVAAVQDGQGCPDSINRWQN
jgi:hypothetical protein